MVLFAILLNVLALAANLFALVVNMLAGNYPGAIINFLLAVGVIICLAVLTD